jgi:hypothetical protein
MGSVLGPKAADKITKSMSIVVRGAGKLFVGEMVEAGLFEFIIA